MTKHFRFFASTHRDLLEKYPIRLYLDYQNAASCNYGSFGVSL